MTSAHNIIPPTSTLHPPHSTLIPTPELVTATPRERSSLGVWPCSFRERERGREREIERVRVCVCVREREIEGEKMTGAGTAPPRAAGARSGSLHLSVSFFLSVPLVSQPRSTKKLSRLGVALDRSGRLPPPLLLALSLALFLSLSLSLSLLLSLSRSLSRSLSLSSSLSIVVSCGSCRARL